MNTLKINNILFEKRGDIYNNLKNGLSLRQISKNYKISFNIMNYVFFYKQGIYEILNALILKEYNDTYDLYLQKRQKKIKTFKTDFKKAEQETFKNDEQETFKNCYKIALLIKEKRNEQIKKFNRMYKSFSFNKIQDFNNLFNDFENKNPTTFIKENNITTYFYYKILTPIINERNKLIKNSKFVHFNLFSNYDLIYEVRELNKCNNLSRIKKETGLTTRIIKKITNEGF